jgi:hypothetical protein
LKYIWLKSEESKFRGIKPRLRTMENGGIDLGTKVMAQWHDRQQQGTQQVSNWLAAGGGSQGAIGRTEATPR